jgi:flagellar hook-associated protein 3 FlgL
MTFRVTDAQNSSRLAAQVAGGRQRIAAAQERVATGRRINRPSDDPSGAANLMRARAFQTAIEQNRRNAGTAEDQLRVTDGALDAVEQTLDRAQAVLTRGASDWTVGSGAREAIALELEGARRQLLASANAGWNDRYIFGGTRQDAPPFDPATGAAALSATAPQLIQVEPGGSPVVAGVTAETIFADAFGTVFETLTNAVTALRGTGDETADRAALLDSLDRLDTFSNQAHATRARVGANLETIAAAVERLGRDSFTYETTATNIESADFAEAAIELTQAERALEAILQGGAHTGRLSFIDLLG